MSLVEYGSYACARCQVVHQVVEELRNRFGDRMRYVFRHLPISGNQTAVAAAELAEAAEASGRFWELHEALMERGPAVGAGDLEQIARALGLPGGAGDESLARAARARVQGDGESSRLGGVGTAPAFFINGRRYTGPWDESSLADAMLGSLGHRVQSAAFDFVRWGPASGLLLALATLVALGLSNSPLRARFAAFWDLQAGVHWGASALVLPVVDWVNHGLLTIFFVVVGLEIKREFTVGHLATVRSGALPVIAAFGGILLPAVIYSTIAPPELRHGWGIPIGTDTAFAVALMVLLGARVPVELRVFLTAAVIIDDIVAILVIALFYTSEIHVRYLIPAAVVTALLFGLNRAGVYRLLPYAVLGVLLWVLLHESGLHATLAGVVLAVLVPARPPANLKALMAQAATVIHLEDRHTGEAMRSGPSAPVLHTLNTIHRRVESPADRALRTVEPWSSYFVLPIFALANAGVAWSLSVLAGREYLALAIVLGLVVGKPVGIMVAARLAVGLGVAAKPDAYSWRQLGGAGALAGIGFTMALFIASAAFPDPADYAAAKIAIFVASLVAGGLGVLILWPKAEAADEYGT
jgi:NhaA family Na+:H+ antiporter